MSKVGWGKAREKGIPRGEAFFPSRGKKMRGGEPTGADLNTLQDTLRPGYALIDTHPHSLIFLSRTHGGSLSLIIFFFTVIYNRTNHGRTEGLT